MTAQHVRHKWKKQNTTVNATTVKLRQRFWSMKNQSPRSTVPCADVKWNIDSLTTRLNTLIGM